MRSSVVYSLLRQYVAIVLVVYVTSAQQMDHFDPVPPLDASNDLSVA